jgi:hypothetical protein
MAKRDRYQAYADRALADLAAWLGRNAEAAGVAPRGDA